MSGEHTKPVEVRSEDRRITFRCKYPDNCSCCPPNREAFVAVREDAERLQREQTEDLKRMERATETIERLTRERQLIADEFTKRADWLRSEYLNGGNFEHLKAREDECRYLAEKVKKGITP